MSGEGRVKRAYRSDTRERAARERRLAVIGAATRLFVERGYGATSVEAVAAEAGVGRATVFAVVGGKPALMRAAYEVAVAGGDEQTSSASDSWFDRMDAARSGAGVLDAYAEVLAEVHARVAPVYESLRVASGTDVELTGLLDELDAARLAGARNIVAKVQEHTVLRPGLAPDEAADVLWVLGDPGTYRRLVATRGWDTARFRVWFAGAMRRELLEAR
ncbi:TetR family transcriptional regulator [Pseudonocardia ailaonensis]|uniref:TetR family transcriptional regulator n=1 Tax=Pseudonocardia ailaonensis TaxID=367279 RepID=A0ABN2MSW8_9PSEU